MGNETLSVDEKRLLAKRKHAQQVYLQSQQRLPGLPTGPTASQIIPGAIAAGETASELPAIYGERAAAGKPGLASDVGAGGAQALQDIYGAAIEKLGGKPVITPEQYQQTGPAAGVTRLLGNIAFDPLIYAPLGAPSAGGRIARAAAAGAGSGALRSGGEVGPTLLGGALGGLGGTAVEGLLKAPAWLQGQAPRALGFTQGQFKSAAQKARQGIGPSVEELAQESVDMGIVKPFTTGKGMAQRVFEKEAEVGAKIGSIQHVLQQAKAGDIDVPLLINDVEMRLADTYKSPAMKEYAPAYERLLGELRGLEADPRFKSAQALKTRLGKERYSQTTGEPVTGERSQVAGRVYPLLSSSMEEGVTRGLEQLKSAGTERVIGGVTVPSDITVTQNVIGRLQSDLSKAQQTQQGAAKVAAFARDEYKPFIGTQGQVGKSLRKLFDQEETAAQTVQNIGKELETNKGLLEMLQQRQEIASGLPQEFGRDYEQLKRQYQILETLKQPVARKEGQEATNRLFTLPAQLTMGMGGASGNVAQGAMTAGLLEALKRFGAPTMTWAGVRAAPGIQAATPFIRGQLAPRLTPLAGMAAQGARREEPKPKRPRGGT